MGGRTRLDKVSFRLHTVFIGCDAYLDTNGQADDEDEDDSDDNENDDIHQ